MPVSQPFRPSSPILGEDLMGDSSVPLMHTDNSFGDAPYLSSFESSFDSLFRQFESSCAPHYSRFLTSLKQLQHRYPSSSFPHPPSLTSLLTSSKSLFLPSSKPVPMSQLQSFLDAELASSSRPEDMLTPSQLLSRAASPPCSSPPPPSPSLPNPNKPDYSTFSTERLRSLMDQLGFKSGSRKAMIARLDFLFHQNGVSFPPHAS